MKKKLIPDLPDHGCTTIETLRIRHLTYQHAGRRWEVCGWACGFVSASGATLAAIFVATPFYSRIFSIAAAIAAAIICSVNPTKRSLRYAQAASETASLYIKLLPEFEGHAQLVDDIVRTERELNKAL